MKLLYFVVQKRICITIFIFLFVLPVPLFAAQYTEELSTEEYLFAKGRVRDVSLANQTLTIQEKDGKRITVLVNAQTELKGFEKIENLQGSDVIKIWYREDKIGNIGLKIFKLPELGC